MLKQGTVKDLRRGRITRRDGYVAIVMQHYPRGLRKGLSDAYIRAVAPDRALLESFHDACRKLDGNHDRAFEAAGFETRFEPGPIGFQQLKLLSDLSRLQDVYLICQCGEGERCHREMLMIAAAELFHARIGPLSFDYPDSRSRLARLERHRNERPEI